MTSGKIRTRWRVQMKDHRQKGIEKEREEWRRLFDKFIHPSGNVSI
jgi:hypothetical protein